MATIRGSSSIVKPKSKSKEMNDLWFANNDIPFNILSRLPSQNLLGLKGVSKDWQRLISEPSFIRQKMKTKEPVSGFFFQDRGWWFGEDVSSISFIKNPENSSPGRVDIQKAVFDFLPENIVLLSASNGLVCCCSRLPCSQPTIYVSNPTNKEWVTLQCPETDKSTALGLAFDPLENSSDKTTNFKVVRILLTTMTDTDDDLANFSSTFSFEVYSSKTRTWVKSKETCSYEQGPFKDNGVCVRGKLLFWLTHGDKIIMFDTENDVARFLSIPAPLMDPASMCIGESEEKLHYVLASKEGIQVWALEDHVEFNWEPKYFVDLDEMETENYEFLCNLKERVAKFTVTVMYPLMEPLSYKDGILLMRVSRKIYTYDFATGKVKILCNNSALGPFSMYAPSVHPYSMSLVPLAWP